MTPSQRLDQIEPVLAELIVKQDLMEKKLNSLTELVEKQSDNISFLLKNQLKISERIDNIDVRLDKMDERFDRIEIRLDRMEERFDKFALTQDAILAILTSKN